MSVTVSLEASTKAGGAHWLPKETAVEPRERIIVALDGMSLSETLSLAEMLSGKVWGFKITDFLIEYGSQGARELRKFGRIFADLNVFHTPKIVANTTRRMRDMGADFMSVHAQGGVPMMQAAVRQADGMKIFAETLLSSISAEGTYITYYAPGRNQSYAVCGADAVSVVTSLLSDAREAGVHGLKFPPSVTASFATSTAPAVGNKPLVAVLGIRPLWYPAKDDHLVTLTPTRAVECGVDYLVIGGPITKAGDPERAVEELVREIAEAEKSDGPSPV